LFVLGALSASGASIMWLMSIDRLGMRAIASIIVFGLIGWGTVELFRFAGHTEPIVVSPSSPSPTPQTLLSPPEKQTQANVPAVLKPTKNRTEAKSRRSGVERPTSGQVITNSPGAMQAGRDITVGQKPSPAPTKEDKKP
jgi:hypothetical protein